MSKIKLIVEIEKRTYELIKDKPDNIAESIIAHGTPLPEGHGRLIEEPTETDISNTVGGNNDFAECIRDSVKAVFDNATTIIEADKEKGGAE